MGKKIDFEAMAADFSDEDKAKENFDEFMHNIEGMMKKVDGREDRIMKIVDRYTGDVDQESVNKTARATERVMNLMGLNHETQVATTVGLLTKLVVDKYKSHDEAHDVAEVIAKLVEKNVCLVHTTVHGKKE